MSSLHLRHLLRQRAAGQIGIGRPVIPRELTRSYLIDDLRTGVGFLGSQHRVRHINSSVSGRDGHEVINIEPAETRGARVIVVVELFPKRLTYIGGVISRVVAIEILCHGIASEVLERLLTEAIGYIEVLDACIVRSRIHNAVRQGSIKLRFRQLGRHTGQTHCVPQAERVGKAFPCINVAVEHRVAGDGIGVDIKQCCGGFQFCKEIGIEVVLLVILRLRIAGYISQPCLGKRHIAVVVRKQSAYINPEDTERGMNVRLRRIRFRLLDGIGEITDCPGIEVRPRT